MKYYEHKGVNFVQGDLEFANSHGLYYFDLIICLCETGMCPKPEYKVKLIPIDHNETPSDSDLSTIVSLGTECLNAGRKLLIACSDGQHRSSTISALIQAVFEKRSYSTIVDEYHRKFIGDTPIHNWYPYTHWNDAIRTWFENHSDISFEEPRTTHVLNPEDRFPKNLLDYRFKDFRTLESDMMLAKWSRPDYLASLYTYAYNLSKPALIVEIGTQFGESTMAMGHAIRGTDSHIITIDPGFRKGGVNFDGDSSPEAPRYTLSILDMLENISAQKLEGYITVVPDYSWNVLDRWDNRKIDLVFIDGNHTYLAVTKDCLWLQFVKPGGFAVFDDWIEPVERATKEYIQDKPEWHIIYESTTQRYDHYCVTIAQKHGC